MNNSRRKMLRGTIFTTIGLIVLLLLLYKKILRKDPTYLESKSYITSDFEKYLEPLKDKIDWSKGKYDFGDGNIRSIMDIQNTSKDIDLFRNFILSQI